jgi:hypothetical protein
MVGEVISVEYEGGNASSEDILHLKIPILLTFM